MEKILSLKDWAIKNEPDDNLIYKNGFWDQVLFMRDKLPWVFVMPTAREYPKDNSYGLGASEIYRVVPRVISTHMSKSVTLPVVEYFWRDFRFTLRYNFHNWKVSVESPIVLSAHVKFYGLTGTEEIHPVYCEGFPGDRVFGTFEGSEKFTIELGNSYDVYTFLYLLVNQVYEPTMETERINKLMEELEAESEGLEFAVGDVNDADYELICKIARHYAYDEPKPECTPAWEAAALLALIDFELDRDGHRDDTDLFWVKDLVKHGTRRNIARKLIEVREVYTV